MNSQNTRQPSRYVVITPVRDEAMYVEHTIRSMLGQTVRPAQWIVVNDGSTDGTAEILNRWAIAHPWIVPVHRPDRGHRAPGSGVVQAFYAGYERITEKDWDFIVKLDGDLSFAPDYFEKCLAEFQADPALGIGGGVICHQQNGTLRPERNPRFHVRGATKIYRRACWQNISGVLAAPGWDTIDEVKANMLGWSTRTFLTHRLVQHRPTGAANGTWRNAVKDGMASYISGYHPLFMFLKSLKISLRKPVVSLGLLWGFVLSHLRRVPQVDDNDLIRYLRSQQLRRLFFMNSIWR